MFSCVSILPVLIKAKIFSGSRRVRDSAFPVFRLFSGGDFFFRLGGMTITPEEEIRQFVPVMPSENLGAKWAQNPGFLGANRGLAGE
jgi:hypothetical protein